MAAPAPAAAASAAAAAAAPGGERDASLLPTLAECTRLEAGPQWCLVLNLGRTPVALPDGTALRNCESGLFRGVELHGERLVVLSGLYGREGEDADADPRALEVPAAMIERIRRSWTPVSELFPAVAAFHGADFYRSPKVHLAEGAEAYSVNFWYCGPHFNCAIHNDHDFFELHTQVLGRGEMRKYRTQDPATLWHRSLLLPGCTHAPFFNAATRLYGMHAYESVTPCIWIAIESQTPLPRPPPLA